MIHERFHRPLIYAGLAVVLAVQFSFYFTGNVITGWDTLGHLHLAREYARLFPWESTGFDSVWFQGFPAFYFYPPFFYFAVNALSTLTTLTITAAFNVGIFLIILFFAFSFVRLGVKLFPQHITSSEAHWAAAAGSLFYLTFPGDGLQGTSAVGVLSGTFVSTLGHAMILQMLSGLLQFRGSKKNLNLFSSAAWFSLTLYTHGLSSFFGGVLLVLFVLYFHRDFRPRHIALLFGLPVLMALPIILRFLLRSHYTSGSPYSAYYPVLLSILGTDFFKAVSTHDVRTIVQNVIFGWKTPIFAFVLLYGWGILRSPRGSLKPEARWILLTGFLFFWAALDNSLVYILPRFPVHWYRAFDYFLISLAMIGSVMIPECRAFLPRWLGPHAGAAAAALLALRLLSWDIAGHQSYQSVLFDDYAGRDDLSLVRSHLQSLPKNSLFLPELIREKEYHGSPHALLHIVEEAGHRNILGLTVESSLTPNVTYARLFAGLPEIFVWGIDHGAIYKAMAATGGGNPRLLIDYLRDAGVQYLIGRTGAMRSFAQMHPQDFRLVAQTNTIFVYQVTDSAPEMETPRDKPVAWIDADAFAGRSSETPASFLMHAAAVRNALPGLPRMVRMTEGRALNTPEQRRLFSAVIIYAEEGREVSHESLPLGAWTDLPEILVNIRAPADGRYTLLRRVEGGWGMLKGRDVPESSRVKTALIPGSVESTRISATPGSKSGSPAFTHVRRSYFPDWRAEVSQTQIFQTDLNTMMVLSPEPVFTLVFRDPFSRWGAVMLLLFPPIGLCILYMRWRTRAAGRGIEYTHASTEK